MALRIIWSPLANQGLDDVLHYLNKEWTFREILTLESKIDKVISQILEHPQSFERSKRNKAFSKAVVDKNNILYYRVDTKNRILEIVDFCSTKQRPKY